MSALAASGEEFPVEVAIVANKLRGSVCFTATIRDLTLRKHAEMELARAAMLRQADRVCPTGRSCWTGCSRPWPGPSARMGCSP